MKISTDHIPPLPTPPPPEDPVVGYAFQSFPLRQLAVTHRSWTHEQAGEHNERLEFLGDAVLQVCTSTLLFQRYPSAPEGALSRVRARLVRTDTLAEIARERGLGAQLRLGKGEESTGGRDRESILADAMEALLGAVYLEAGLSACEQVVTRWFGPRLPALDQELAEGYQRAWKDAKNRLQEHFQAKPERVTPHYQTLAEDGPPHQRVFTVAVYVGESLLGQGQGPSKPKAAQAAAEQALDRLFPPPGRA